MYYPRIIPVLLLQNEYLVKSEAFKRHNYIGDPMHAVHIFNTLKVDELVFLDIEASKKKRSISLEFVKGIAEEARMPFSVGGGISSIDEIRSIIGAGAEKVVLNTVAAENPDFVRQAADAFGSSTIVVCIDVKKNWLGKEHVYIYGGTKSTGKNPVEYAKEIQSLGAGEIIIQSIDNDGMRSGYNIPLIRSISENVTIPVVALGGAGVLSDFNKAYTEGYASSMAAGSMFVYQGNKKGVLINYPKKDTIGF
ncbi:MAG: AglZ/HisF2 family acetamidino modification protein [Bacteroidota bacterium]